MDGKTPPDKTWSQWTPFSIQACAGTLVGRGFAGGAQLRAQPAQRDGLGGGVVVERVEQETQMVVEIELVLGQHVFDFGQPRRVVRLEGVRHRVPRAVLRRQVGRRDRGAGQGGVGRAELSG